MRAIDRLRERRVIGAGDHAAADLLTKLKPGEAGYEAAILALDRCGEAVLRRTLAVVLAGAQGDAGNSANRRGRFGSDERNLDQLLEGLDALYQHFVEARMLQPTQRPIIGGRLGASWTADRRYAGGR